MYKIVKKITKRRQARKNSGPAAVRGRALVLFVDACGFLPDY
jgi:hypothetical protein